MILHGINLDSEAVRGFCRKWRIRELEVFGSILGADFRPESDVDLLAAFDEDAEWGILDLVQMETELAVIIGRKVDLVDRESIEQSPNYIRRKHILSTAERVYAQG